MKIKLDENLLADLAIPLERLGHDVDSVVQEDLAGKDDRTAWNAAQEEERFLISQDLYFTDIRQHSHGTHHGVLLVRLVEPSREAFIVRIVTIFESEDGSSWHCCNVVATNRKVRVRRSTA